MIDALLIAYIVVGLGFCVIDFLIERKNDYSDGYMYPERTEPVHPVLERLWLGGILLLATPIVVSVVMFFFMAAKAAVTLL